MPYISPLLTGMANAVKKAAVAMTRDFNELEHLQNSVRKDNSFALHSAEKIEKTIKVELAKIKPSLPVICRSEEIIPADGHYFLLAPVDGFANFAHGNAAFAVSLAYVENNIVTDAIVYSPIYDELFFAEKGCGAFKEGFRNHERLRVAGTREISHSLIRCSANSEIIVKALSLSSNLSVSGCVSLDMAHLASAKLDGIIYSGASKEALAAGMLLVKEAGGYIAELGEKDVRSEDFNKILFGGNLIAANEILRQKIANTMAR